MKVWLAKKVLGGITEKVMKAREIKRLRDYVEKDNELDIQMKQVLKTLENYGKTLEVLEKDNATSKKKINKLEKRR